MCDNDWHQQYSSTYHLPSPTSLMYIEVERAKLEGVKWNEREREGMEKQGSKMYYTSRQ